ncbi:hypothetical protein [Actinoplanes missouriensis]|nr:hypothetical protein [Actinoplanes missouriensis]
MVSFVVVFIALVALVVAGIVITASVLIFRAARRGRDYGPARHTRSRSGGSSHSSGGSSDSGGWWDSSDSGGGWGSSDSGGGGGDSGGGGGGGD